MQRVLSPLRPSHTAVLAILVLAGCSGSPSEPGAHAVAALGDVLEMIDGADPADGTAEPWLHLSLPLGPACDAAPEIDMEERCGRTVVRAARFAWDSCDLGDARGHASGSLEIARALPEDGACDGARRRGVPETAHLVLAREGPHGRMSLEGTATSTFNGGAGEFGGSASRHVELDLIRTMTAGESAFSRSAHLRASLNVSRRTDETGTSRVMNGTGTLELPRGGSVSIALEGVVRPSRGVCAHPIAGTLTRIGPDGVSHVMAFGPSCGEATLDGAPLDLETAGRGSHGGRPRGI